MISFPPGTEIFQFPGFASVPYVFRYGYPLRGGFPHSDIAGSMLVASSTDAFRRLPRPSSPLTAKASTVCAYSLDHITPSRLWHWRVAHTSDRPSNFAYLPQRHAFETRMSPKRLLRPKLSKNDDPDLNVRLSKFVCACDPSCFERAGVCEKSGQGCRAARRGTCSKADVWWVWEDSNHRPHPYQGCALTT